MKKKKSSFQRCLMCLLCPLCCFCISPKSNEKQNNRLCIFRLICSLRIMFTVVIFVVVTLFSLFSWLPSFLIHIFILNVDIKNSSRELSVRVEEHVQDFFFKTKLCAYNLETSWYLGDLSNYRVNGTNGTGGHTSLNRNVLWREMINLKEFVQAPTLVNADWDNQYSTYHGYGYTTDPEEFTYWYHSYDTGTDFEVYSVDPSNGQPNFTEPVNVLKNWDTRKRPYYSYIHENCETACHYPIFAAFDVGMVWLLGGFGMRVFNVSDPTQEAGVALCMNSLEELSKYLQSIFILNDGFVVISEKSGDLVASSKKSIKLAEQVPIIDELTTFETIRTHVYNIEVDDVGENIKSFFEGEGIEKRNIEIGSDEVKFTCEGDRCIQISGLIVDNLEWNIIIIQDLASVYRSVIISTCSSFVIFVFTFVSLCCCGCCLLRCLLRPIFHLKKSFKQISKMSLDRIKFRDYQITEFYDISRSLEACVEWLKEYKQFIPTGIVNDEFEEKLKCISDTDTELIETNNNIRRRKSNSEDDDDFDFSDDGSNDGSDISSNSSKSSNNNDSKSLNSTDGRETIATSIFVSPERKRFAIAMKKVELTVISIFISFNRLLSVPSSDIQDCFSKIYSIVVKNTKTCIHKFDTGNKIKVIVDFSFSANNINNKRNKKKNKNKRRFNYAKCGCDYALHILSEVERIKKDREIDLFSDEILEIIMAVTTKTVYFGNIGFENKKQLTIADDMEMIQFEDYLLNTARNQKCPIVIDSRTKNGIYKEKFKTRKIDEFINNQNNNNLSKKKDVYHLIGKTGVKMDEWNYEMEEIAKIQIYDKYSKARKIYDRSKKEFNIMMNSKKLKTPNSSQNSPCVDNDLSSNSNNSNYSNNSNNSENEIIANYDTFGIKEKEFLIEKKMFFKKLKKDMDEGKLLLDEFEEVKKDDIPAQRLRKKMAELCSKSIEEINKDENELIK